MIAGGARFEKDGILLVWNTKTGKVKQFYRSRADVLAARFAPDGKTIVFADIGGGIFSFDVESGVFIRQFSEAVKENPASVGTIKFDLPRKFQINF